MGARRGRADAVCCRGLRWAVALGLVSVSAPAAAERAPAIPFTHVRTGDANTDDAIRRALRRAANRLSRPACQAVLVDFVDDSGRTLQNRLETSGRSIQEHLALLLFYDGSAGRRCASDGVLAFTEPGSRVVFVCGRQFRSQERRDALGTDVLVIHETLHTLGLPENPPTPREISRQVESRCVQSSRGSR